MKLSLQNFKDYVNQIGVKVSIVISIFSILMLVTALLGIEFNNEELESLCFLSLIVEFIYGVILCFNILKNREKFSHLIPFLFLNWFIGCFCTNTFINVFENLPVWVYAVTFLFCVSNFLIYNKLEFKIATPISYFVNGFSFLLIIYFAIFLIPIAPISVVGIIALGLGFYGLVPMIVLISHSITLFKNLTISKRNGVLFWSGIASVFIGMSFFTAMLNIESKKIEAFTATKSF